MPVSQTWRGRNPRSHFPGKKRSERSGSQSASSTSPHNPAHSWNSIIQLSFPAKPMQEYGSWGHFGHVAKEEEDLADSGGCHGHVSQWSAARFYSVSVLHALSPSSLHPPPSSTIPSLRSLAEPQPASDTVHLRSINNFIPPQNTHTNNFGFQRGTFVS